MSNDHTPGGGAWERLCQVAVKGAEYDSRERQPRPECLEGTRVALLNHIYGLLDNREKSRLIWLHGTAGVGKSAVAFTVAERMRGLKVAEQTTVEMRLAATFFFSRKHTQRCTTGYFFATLAYQLACNFPSIREEMNTAIRENPGLLHYDKSPHAQMEALFLRPLRELRFRLRECPPLVFVIDALDECTSETEIADLIALLGRALHQLDQPDLPVIHILLTSRSEAHIGEAMHGKDVHSLVCEIPVKTSGKGIASTISLDGTDVDNDIYIFLEHSFRKLQSRHPGFPLPTTHQLACLASRAGRRFIVASTMIKFIDDGYNDPRDRLQLMLDLTSNLLPGTEVYKLYDHILSTCTDPKRAYLHLSIVSSLADPLPISQISNLLGPGEGKDVESSLIQLRSVMDIPTDSSLPVNIHHSSVRDYVSDPSNCSLLEGHHITSPDSLLARSSLRLMVQDMPENTAFLDAFSELSRQSRAMRSNIPQRLQHTLSFIVLPPEPLQILLGLLWLRRDYSDPYSCQWLETLDGHAWLQTPEGKNWLQTHWGRHWLWDKCRKDWLQTHGGQDWLQTLRGQCWMQTKNGQSWLQIQGGQDWLQTKEGKDWVLTQHEQGWVQTKGGQNWLQTKDGQDWLQSQNGQDWLHTEAGQEWLQTYRGRAWLQTDSGYDWVHTKDGRDWLQTKASMQDWVQTQGGQAWLQTMIGQDWLQTKDGKDWLQTHSGRAWLQTRGGRNWLQTERGRAWLQTSHGQAWQSTPSASVWVTMEEFSTILEDINKYIIAQELHLVPTFQVIQQFKSLPDFLMFPVFLALKYQDQSSTSALPQVAFPPNTEVVHAMRTFVDFAKEAQKQSQTASAALKYACQNWAVHLSRTQNPWDATLDHIFKAFWDHHLPSWLERQWCLKGLQSCLVILSEGQKLAKEHLLLAPRSPPPPV